NFSFDEHFRKLVLFGGKPQDNRKKSDLDVNSLQYFISEENYLGFLNSGIFWELFPELSGDWKKDKKDWEDIMIKRYTERYLCEAFSAPKGECMDLYKYTIGDSKQVKWIDKETLDAMHEFEKEQ